MRKNRLQVFAGFLMAVALALVACAPAANTPSATNSVTPQPSVSPTTAPAGTGVTTAPSLTPEPTQAPPAQTGADKPQYGGTLRRVLTADVTSFDFFSNSFAPGVTVAVTNEGLVIGDWTKGSAGGYGTGETDWAMGYDVLSQKAGLIAESWKWSADFGTNTAKLVYQIRPGIHFALNPNSEASRLVGGREMTADDVIYTMQLLTTDKRNYLYNASPDLRAAKIEKTGPWEVTVSTNVDSLMNAFQRLNYWTTVIPKEVVNKYGNMSDWETSVGTGPFMLVNNVPGSVVDLSKNTNYWMTNPIGPGKGDQLPYIDGVRYIIIPDASTRFAALRSAKVDQIYNVSLDDAQQLEKTTPELVEMEQPVFGAGPISLRVDLPPFDDIRVRQAILMATDLEAIRQGLRSGRGQIITWPWPVTKGYEATFAGIDDPRIPQSVRDLYSYNPDKSKQLLAEAGYPNGLKVEALMTNTEVDYYSILKDQWSKVGIELSFMIRETGAKTALLSAGTHPPIVSSGVPQARMYFFLPHAIGTNGVSNPSMMNDPVMNDGVAEVARTMITDEDAAMAIWGNKLMPYFLGQAYAIPTPVAPNYNFWWPWLKNYSGEIQVGESLRHQDNWFRFIWLDQALKKQMGH